MSPGDEDRGRSSYGTQPRLVPTPGPIPSVGSDYGGQQSYYGHDQGLGENRGGVTQTDYGSSTGHHAQYEVPPGLLPPPTEGLRHLPPEYASDGRPPPGLDPRTAAEGVLPASGPRPEMLGEVHQEQSGQFPMRQKGPTGSKPQGQGTPEPKVTASTATPEDSERPVEVC